MRVRRWRDRGGFSLHYRGLLWALACRGAAFRLWPSSLSSYSCYVMLAFRCLPSLFVCILAGAHIWRFSFFDWTDCRLVSVFESSSPCIHILFEDGVRNRSYDGLVQHGRLCPLLDRANGFVLVRPGSACSVGDSAIQMRYCVAGSHRRLLCIVAVRRIVFNCHVEGSAVFCCLGSDVRHAF